jgi:hypothetical protein
VGDRLSPDFPASPRHGSQGGRHRPPLAAPLAPLHDIAPQTSPAASSAGLFVAQPRLETIDGMLCDLLAAIARRDLRAPQPVCQVALAPFASVDGAPGPAATPCASREWWRGRLQAFRHYLSCPSQAAHPRFHFSGRSWPGCNHTGLPISASSWALVKP